MPEENGRVGTIPGWIVLSDDNGPQHYDAQAIVAIISWPNTRHNKVRTAIRLYGDNTNFWVNATPEEVAGMVSKALRGNGNGSSD